MFDLEMSKSSPTDCFLKKTGIYFPNPIDLPVDHKLFDLNKYTIPSNFKCGVVNKGVLQETYLTDAKETETSTLNDVFTPEEGEKIKSGTSW